MILGGEIKTVCRHMDSNQMLSVRNKLLCLNKTFKVPSGYFKNERPRGYGIWFAIVFPKAFRPPSWQFKVALVKDECTGLKAASQAV